MADDLPDVGGDDGTWGTILNDFFKGNKTFPALATEAASITNRIVHAWFGGSSNNTYSTYDLADHDDLGALINQVLTDAGSDAVAIQTPAGDITWSTPVTITNSNITIAGWGHGAGKISGEGLTGDLLQIGDGSNRPENILIRDLRIDGTDSGSNNSNDCIVLKKFRNVHLYNIYERDFRKGLVIDNQEGGTQDQIDFYGNQTVWEGNTQEGIHIDGTNGSGDTIHRINFVGGYSFGNRRALLSESDVDYVQFSNYEFSSSDKENIKLTDVTHHRFYNFRAETANKNDDGSYTINLDAANKCVFSGFKVNNTDTALGVRVDGAHSKWSNGDLETGSFDFPVGFEGSTDIVGVRNWVNIAWGDEIDLSDGTNIAHGLDDSAEAAFANSKSGSDVAMATGLNDTNVTVAVKSISDGSTSSATVFWYAIGETAPSGS